jgi:predicted metallopeptidase
VNYSHSSASSNPRFYAKAEKNKKNHSIVWESAPDVKKRIKFLQESLNLDWLKTSDIYCFRSSYSRSRAIARIWGFSRVWQTALNVGPKYIIEVLSEKYDRLSQRKRDEVLLHEIIHIPKNFSGALVPHFRRGKRKFNYLLSNLVTSYKNKLMKAKDPRHSRPLGSKGHSTN